MKPIRGRCVDRGFLRRAALHLGDEFALLELAVDAGPATNQRAQERALQVDLGQFVLRRARGRVAGQSSINVERSRGTLDDLFRDHDLLDAFETGQVEHGVEERSLHD